MSGTNGAARSEEKPQSNGGESAPLNAHDAPTSIPAFRVGPIATDKEHAISAAVWASSATLEEGHLSVTYSVTLESHWYNPELPNPQDGQVGGWKPVKGFRVSQIATVQYCLRKCADYIRTRRTPQAR